MKAPVESVGWVRASDLARQLSCEYRVHIERLWRRERVPLRGLYADLRALGLQAERLEGVVEGVPLVAQPLYVDLDGVRVYLRARRGDPLGARVSAQDRVYLATLRLLLRERRAPFCLAVLVVDAPASAREALEYLSSTGKCSGLGHGWRLLSVYIDEEEAYRLVRPLLSFWLGERPPKPAARPSACRGCPYRDECPYYKREGPLAPRP